jgi:monoterpene epsilon-lactone hydrolase
MPSEAHEQMVQFILENPTPDDASTADRRAGFDQFLLSMPLPEDVAVTPAEADGVALDWVSVPESRDERVVFLVHGGGGCMGSARTYREFAARIARAARARVAVPDYRLAPEAPFPAGVDDLVTAYRWLLAEGVSPAATAVVGDSGGVGIALTAVTRARDEHLAPPAAFVGFAPWIDFSVGDTIAEAEDVGDPISTPASLTFFASQYLQGHPETDPLANALHADLRGLPPLLLLAGTRDVGYGDALWLAKRARAAGVPTTVRTFHGLVHNWQMAAHLPEAADAIDAAAGFMDEHLVEITAPVKEAVR